MRKACKAFASLSLAVGFVVTCAAFARAQNREEHFVSARAGGVNFVSGEVTFRRAGRDAWQQLATTDELKSGDAVRTGANGRAEILLNPGSYLRLGENSEFELTDASLDTLRLKLLRGSALVEAAGFDDAGFAVALDTPQTRVSLIRSGIYRFNVSAAGATEVFVRKGRALVGRERALVKEGMSARVTAAGSVDVAKFDKKEKDALDLWGKERAEEIARVTRKLQLKQVNAAFARNPWNGFYGSNNNNLFGVWLYSPRFGCYSFLPFYQWVSPYGYTSDFIPIFAGPCGSCQRRVFNQRPQNPSGGGGTTASSGTPTAGMTPSPSHVPPSAPPDTGSPSFPSRGGGGSSSSFGGGTPPPATVSRPGGASMKGVPTRDNY
jgi:hypothetical protein